MRTRVKHGARSGKHGQKNNYKQPNSIDEIVNQIIWYNTGIQINGSPINIPKIREKGITYIRDIYDFHKKGFKTIEMLEYDFGLSTKYFLEYRAIIDAIPRNWKNSLRNETFDQMYVQDSLVQQIIEKPKVSKYLYDLLLSKEYPPKYGAMYVWNENIQISIEEEQWDKIRLSGHKLTISVKLRYFQMRLLANKITTNYNRARWDATVSPFCKQASCQGETPDTIMHVLYKCSKAKTLWEKLKKWCKYVLDIDMKIDQRIVILNDYKGAQSWLINTVILVTKQYLYASYCLNENPNFMVLISKIVELYRAEKELAGNNKKHVKKWSAVIKYLF